MKILLLVNNVFYEKKGSLYTYRAIGEFANKLIELGNEVEMLQTRLKKDEEFHNFDLKLSKIKTTAIKRFKSKVFTYFIVYIVGIWKVYKSDFVYIYYPTNYHYFAFFSILFRKKYGLNVRGQKGADSQFSKFLYKYAEVVFTVSPNFTELVNISGGYGITQRPGISYNYNDIVSNKELSPKVIYNLLYLGRLDVDKGLIELLEAVDIIKRKKIYEFKVTIVGDGYHEEYIKNISDNLKLNDIVNFHGPENNLIKIRNIYLESDLFILPTHHEGFPRTLYEAMIFGVPIITTFVGGISSRMNDNYNCLKIEKKSPLSIVDKVEYAFNNYKKLNHLVTNAEITIREILRPDKLEHAEELHKYLNKC
jgi:glycosyltransferase involved in cell wall biosynthesis